MTTIRRRIEFELRKGPHRHRFDTTSHWPALSIQDSVEQAIVRAMNSLDTHTHDLIEVKVTDTFEKGEEGRHKEVVYHLKAKVYRRIDFTSLRGPGSNDEPQLQDSAKDY